jgi:hypothetical protein
MEAFMKQYKILTAIASMIALISALPAARDKGATIEDSKSRSRLESRHSKTAKETSELICPVAIDSETGVVYCVQVTGKDKARLVPQVSSLLRTTLA